MLLEITGHAHGNLRTSDPHQSLRSWWGLRGVFRDYAMEQLFQVLIVGTQPAHHDVVHLGQLEERLGRPAGGNLHAVLSPAIVVKYLHRFKAQLVEKSVRFALNMQAVAILPSATKLLNGPLAQDAPLVQDDDGIANPVDIAQKMGRKQDRLAV